MCRRQALNELALHVFSFYNGTEDRKHATIFLRHVIIILLAQLTGVLPQVWDFVSATYLFYNMTNG